jgi:hypothetical protein
MPSPNSHADVIRDWMLVLEATERSPEVQAEVEKERLKVAQLLAEVQALKARQVELTALRQQATQQLKATVAQGKEAVMQFRAILKAKFGPRNERLVQFNMAPLRKRSRKLVEKKPTEFPTVKPVA